MSNVNSRISNYVKSLEQQNQELKAKNQQLERGRDQRDLEQQIKVLDELQHGLTWSKDLQTMVLPTGYIAHRMEQLRKQAGDL